MTETDRLAVSEDVPTAPSVRVQSTKRKRQWREGADELLPNEIARKYKLCRRDLTAIHDTIGVLPVGTMVGLKQALSICADVCGKRFPCAMPSQLGVLHAFLESTPNALLSLVTIAEFRVN